MKKTSSRRTKAAARVSGRKARTSRTTNRNAGKTTRRPAKKIAKRVAKKATKRVAKKAKRSTARRNAPKRSARKVAKRVVKKRVAKKTTPRIAKKTTPRVAKKTTRRIAKKTTPRVAKKTTKRVAKKTTKRVAKKTTKRSTARRNAPKRAARKVAKRVAKKPVAKKTTRRVAKKATTKRTVKVLAVPKRTAAKTTQRAARTATAPRPAAPSAPAVAPAPPAPTRTLPQGVRLGRLAPRAALAKPPPRASAPPPSTTRAPFTQETWKEVDAAAARLGIAQLRSEQRHVIRALVEGRDALVVLPAGIGKSSTVLIAAQLLRQPVVVVSPLVSLLRAEHDRLLQRRIPGVRVDASIHGAERRQALSRIAEGGSLMVLTTPDGLCDDELVAALSRSGVALVAVEEAHTVSEWAHQFRPASARLGEQLWRLGAPPIAALTSTATTETRHDIADRLGLRSPAVFDTAPHRDNVALDVIEARGEVRQRALVSLVMRLRRPGIIFCRTPRDVEAVYGALRALRVPAHRYHGEMPAGERGGEQLNFMVPGRRTVMVATSGFTPSTGIAGLGEIGRLDLTPGGFGLGVQKRDVRFVIHYQSPASLEQYVREIGLAGRDGEPATCVLFHEPADRSHSEALLAGVRIRPRHVSALAEALESYAHEQRPATVEALALAAGQSHGNAELLSAVLADAGLVTLSSGWVRPSVPGPILLEKARRLSARLSVLERQDARRLDAIAEYATSRRCRSLFLSRYFGVLGQEPCGRCGVCKPAEHAVGGDTAAPVRRSPARTFSVSYAGRAYTERDERSSPLTAKLGDFAR